MRTTLAILAITLMAPLAFSQQQSNSNTTTGNQPTANQASQSASPSASQKPTANPSSTASQSVQSQVNGQNDTGQNTSATSNTTANNGSNTTDSMQMFQSMTFVSSNGRPMDKASAMQRIQSGACMRMQGGQIVIEQ